MKPNTKKKVAKEFLYLLATVVFIIFTSILWIFVAERNSNKAYKLSSRIDELIAPAKPPFRLNLYYYINNEIIEYGEEKLSERDKFITTLREDPTYSSQLYEWIISKGYVGPTSKEEFLRRINEDRESEAYLTQLTTLEEELSYAKNGTFSKFRDEDLIALIIFTLSIAFLLRYIYYATRWSVKTLRTT